MKLSVHLFESPAQSVCIAGDPGRMLNNVYQDERYIRSLDLEHRPRLIEVMARLPILFERVYQQVVPPTQWIRPEWETLEVIVFQATADHPGAQEGRGVGGFYCNIVQPSSHRKDAYSCPHMVLSVMPGSETRLIATAVHEFGHFLRSVMALDIADSSFGTWMYEEGLSEGLVEQILDQSDVIHSKPISDNETHLIMPLLNRCIQANLQYDKVFEEDKVLLRIGYRLGYHYIKELLSQGYRLSDLFLLEARQAELKILSFYVNSRMII